MSYSLDLRERVVSYIKQGGKISEATQIFQVSRATIHRWLKRDNLAPTVVPRRPWKLDWAALAADVAAHPDDRLIDRAQRFGVQVSTISYALDQMGITRKKTDALPRTV